MNKRQFIAQRKPSWHRFKKLIQQFKQIAKKSDAVSPRDIDDYSRLFREMSSDLATVRSRNWGTDLETYLNHLVSQGHGTFYQSPPGQFRQIAQFFWTGFPQLLRANIWYFFTACVLFFGSGAVSWIVVQNDPSLASHVIAESQLQEMKQMYAKSSTNTRPGGADFLMAGYYIQHNTGIALRCFARGVLLGVGTIYTLLFNGILLGAISGYVVSEADSEKFLSFVIGHGSFELTAIAVAGMGGLMLGAALLHPGQKTRLQSLRERGLDAVKIGAGAGMMIIIAAFIEGFWSPSGVPVILKYIVGTLLWIVVIFYFIFVGRGEEQQTV